MFITLLVSFAMPDAHFEKLWPVRRVYGYAQGLAAKRCRGYMAARSTGGAGKAFWSPPRQAPRTRPLVSGHIGLQGIGYCGTVCKFLRPLVPA
jgi:hypothetical protein